MRLHSHTEVPLTPTDADFSAKWKLKREQAAGIILRSLSMSQHIHVKGIMDDPIAMWKKLRSSHRAQVANSRYHAIQKLLSIHKDEMECLIDYVTRVNTATNDLIALLAHSPSKTYWMKLARMQQLQDLIKPNMEPLHPHSSYSAYLTMNNCNSILK